MPAMCQYPSGRTLDVGEADVFWNERESERSKVTVEREDVLDVPLVRQDTGRMVHKGDRLVIVVFELFSRSLEGGSTDRNDVDTLRVSNGVQGSNSHSMSEFVEGKGREFCENEL